MAVQIILPIERLVDHASLTALIAATPSDGVSSYSLWTPQVTEERLLSDPTILGALLRMIGELAGRGIAVGHQYGNYTIAALHDVGLASMTHHLGWVDKGEPVAEQTFALAFADGMGSGASDWRNMLIGDAMGIVAGIMWAATTVVVRSTALSEAPPTTTLRVRGSFDASNSVEGQVPVLVCPPF